MKLLTTIALVFFFLSSLHCESKKSYSLKIKYKKGEFYRYVTSYSNDEMVKLPLLDRLEGSTQRKHNLLEKETSFSVQHRYRNGNMLIRQVESLRRIESPAKKPENFLVTPLMKILVTPDNSHMNLTARMKTIYDLNKFGISERIFDLGEVSYKLPNFKVKIGDHYVQEEKQPNFFFGRLYEVIGVEKRHFYDCLKIYFKEEGSIKISGNKWAEKNVTGVIYFAYKKGIFTEIIEKGTIYYFDFIRINDNHIPIEKTVTYNNLTIIKENTRLKSSRKKRRSHSR